MRSLMLALGVGILALNFAGCSCTINGCAEPGVVSGNCGADCQTCDQECDGGCDECVSGRALLSRPVLNGRVRSAVASVRCRCGAKGDCGCDAGADCGADCGDSCGCGAAAPAPRMALRCSTCGENECGCGGLRGRLGGMGLLQSGGGCTDGCTEGCDDGCGSGLLGSLGRARGCGQSGCGLGGMMCNQCRGGLGSRLGGGLGCGRMGCGQNGNLCGDCSSAGGLMAGGMGFGSRMGAGMGAGMGCGRMGCGVGGRLCGSCMGGRLGSGMGCGRMGCGIGGRLCGSCMANRGRITGGSIPHMQPMPSAAGQVPSYVYPYYTTRAPRDFLMDNPPTIGY